MSFYPAPKKELIIINGTSLVHLEKAMNGSVHEYQVGSQYKNKLVLLSFRSVAPAEIGFGSLQIRKELGGFVRYIYDFDNETSFRKFLNAEVHVKLNNEGKFRYMNTFSVAGKQWISSQVQLLGVYQ